jgi:Immunity protein 53
MTSLLAELSDWHRRHCDGEREHWYGITIQTTDNPGWWVKVDLTGTPLAARRFERVAEAVDANGYPSAERWLNCQVNCQATGHVWHGAGDVSRLEEIVSRFLRWAKEDGAQDGRD